LRIVGWAKIMARRERTSVKQLPSVWFDHQTDLPDWITIRIGQILVE